MVIRGWISIAGKAMSNDLVIESIQSSVNSYSTHLFLKQVMSETMIESTR